MQIALAKNPGIKDNHESTGQSTSTKEAANERRLRKLKGFLKSVSYNGSEGMRLETLNDIYRDDLLLDRSPCTDILTLGEFKCNPTPFLVSSCFNRTQVDTKGRPQRDSKRTLRKSTPSRTRKIPTPKKNTSTLSQIYGKIEGKVETFKSMPSNKLGILKGTFSLSNQGRRSTLDDAVETAVQSGQKEGKEETSGAKYEQMETKEKTIKQKRTKGKPDEDEDNTKQLKSDQEKSGIEIVNSFTTNKEMNPDKTNEIKTPEEKRTQKIVRKERSGNTETLSAAGEKSDVENKSGKSTTEESKETKEKSATGKTSSKFTEVQGNSANTESFFETKKQEIEKLKESNEKCIIDSKLSDCREEAKPEGKSVSMPSVTSPTLTESTKPNTRLQKSKSRPNEADKNGQTRFRSRRRLTYTPKTKASPYKHKNKPTRNQVESKRKQILDKNTPTRSKKI